MKPSIAVLLLAIAIVMIAPRPCEAQDVREFVHRIYFEGIPYQEVLRFDPATAVPVLLQMLADPKEEDYWTNIVVTLGMLGDAKAVDPLIDFLTRDELPQLLSHAKYIAKSSVVMSLGYIVNKSHNEKALEFLLASADPDVWTRRNVKWVSPYHRTEQERNRQLSTMSIIGLGLTGNPKAAEFLRGLRQSSTIRTQIPGIEPVIREALSANETIASKGLAGYYAGKSNPTERTPPKGRPSKRPPRTTP